MPSSRPPVAVIAGPTASGKSALALALAEAANGVIVNADASQLYREIPLLAAAPGTDDVRRVEHRLYGVIDGAESCSAAKWATLVKAEIGEIHAEGRLPILVGGTGLYLRTLLDGIAPVPEIDPAVRAEVRAADVSENYGRLSEADPAAAKALNPADRTRIARALEVALSTGRTLAQWQERKEGGIGDAIALKALILLPPRDWLYRRCDERFAAMVKEGAIEEVKALLKRGLSTALPVMRAIGVRELSAYLAGETTLEEAIVAGSQATRNYAKRQYTWFAHQPPKDWVRFTEVPSEAALELLEAKA